VTQAATQKRKGNRKQGRGRKLTTLNKNPQTKDQHTERGTLTLKDVSIEFILATEQIIATVISGVTLYIYLQVRHWGVYNTRCKGSTSKPNSHLQY